LVLTDQEISIGAALQETQGWKDIPHRLCSWHIGRNLRKYFKFIKSEHQVIKEKIFKLPYLITKNDFDEDEKAILKFLKDLNLTKSLDYLDGLFKIKNKWARPYHLPFFDADITTTSRAESWNRHLKRYVGSRSEITYLIDFINNVDKTNLAFETDLTSDVMRFIEADPLVMELKSFLTPRLYEKQLDQYSKAKKCENKLVVENKDEQVYEVVYVSPKAKPGEIAKVHKVTIKQRIQCTCSYYKRVGLVCLHVFHICGIKNIKTINQLIIANRWRKILDGDEDFHFRFMEDLERGQEEGENPIIVDDIEIREVDDDIMQIPGTNSILEAPEAPGERIQITLPQKQSSLFIVSLAKSLGKDQNGRTSSTLNKDAIEIENFKKRQNPKGRAPGKIH